jgi:hypothetical protein
MDAEFGRLLVPLRTIRGKRALAGFTSIEKQQAKGTIADGFSQVRCVGDWYGAGGRRGRHAGR